LRLIAQVGVLITLALGGCASGPEYDREGSDWLPRADADGVETPAAGRRTLAGNHDSTIVPPAVLAPKTVATGPGPAPLGAEKTLATADGSPSAVEDFEARGRRRELSSREDDKPAIEVRGRIHTDAILINQSEKNKAILGDVENATGFRRARLGAQGTVGEQVNWVAEFDFAGGDISFKDVFVGVNQLPIVRRVRVGHMIEPFSLEGQTSSNYFPFVERSPIMALDPARNWGVGMFSYTDDERATLALAAFRSGTSNASGNDVGDGNDMAYDLRITGLPWYDAASEGRYLMHLGGAFSQRYPKNDIVTFNQGPQSSLLTFSDDPGSPFLPTVKVSASQYQLYNLDWALVLGPLSFQAEWTAADLDQIGGGSVFFNGCYVFASWFLTGENRQYLPRDGTFGMTRVRSPFLCLKGKPQLRYGPGAWELTACFAYVNFNSPNLPPQANGLRVGDRDAELTVGVNWYLNDYARLLFNYVHAVPVDPNFGPSYADAFFIRTAIFW
jgi:phosphate-selective porin OprO/OprP